MLLFRMSDKSASTVLPTDDSIERSTLSSEFLYLIDAMPEKADALRNLLEQRTGGLTRRR